ncbi:MAG: S16 family serine protease, partial [Abditibacteriaceae bacterium]
YKQSQVGVVTGMAWTPRGGEILFIEAVRMPGKGGLTLTGQLGDVMKESARIALDYLRSHSEEVGIPDTCDDDCNIHIHVPAGAIPKDGPSAGVAMTCALASLLTGRKARHDVSMTGEVTLTGRVLPIGGIKEKALAAYQAGITTIILPERNRADLREVPEEIRDAIHFEFVKDVKEAIEKVLLPKDDVGKLKRITARK